VKQRQALPPAQDRPVFQLPGGRLVAELPGWSGLGAWHAPAEEEAPYALTDRRSCTVAAARRLAARALPQLCPCWFLWERGGLAWAVWGGELGPQRPLAQLPVPSGLLPAAAAPADSCELGALFGRAHDLMRSGDGLQPSEALDELLKLLFLLQHRAQLGVPTLLVRRQLRLTSGELVAEGDEAHAQRLRGALAAALRVRQARGDPLLGLESFALSSGTLCRLGDALLGMEGASLPVDLEAAALRVFLASRMRKGLGIYLTPDPVVRAVVGILAPRQGQRILDPACGSGSFLLHTVFRWREQAGDRELRKALLWGVDKSPRMLRVAELNLAPHIGRDFMRSCGDALARLDDGDHPDWFRPGSFDLIMTNPPFGARLPGQALAAAGFSVAGAAGGRTPAQLGSEVAFAERCLDLLRPGGLLGVVLPNGVLTNRGLAAARQALDAKGRLLAVLALPPETFAATGTQAATSLLFFVRRGGSSESGPLPAGAVYAATCRNVGFDSTGRARKGGDLDALAAELRQVVFQGERPGRGRLLRCRAGQELASFAASKRTGRPAARAIPLGDLVSVMRTGRTPPRSAYTEPGGFILKVGNLTGHGIDWSPRERNHVGPGWLERLQRGRAAAELLLQPGDILLTSSAHHVRYIARKADIVDLVPDFVAAPVSYVGELLLVRPNPDRADPFRLLAFLRSGPARRALQAMARGQTAHLSPRDARALPVPGEVIEGEAAGRVAALLREEAGRMRQALSLRREISQRLDSLFPADS